jgi:KDO2-lipid IV(A) lauroyltransferase
MGNAVFYIFYGLNWIITLLPLNILYIFSDLLFILLYYFPSYRRKVVAENLRNSFPNKPENELALIEKKFYRHFTDLFIETLKLTHFSNENLKNHIKVTNPELLNNLGDSGYDIIVVHSHYNNWEWVGACMPLYFKYKNVFVYKPVQNQQFNRFINKLRSKNGAEVVPMKHIVRKIIDNKSKQIRTFYGFVADQTPAKAEIRYYTEFLNQETPVFLGVEKISSRYGMAVVFLKARKVKRGYYEITFELLFEKSSGLPEFTVTETHVKRLEEMINENPEYWIWTHRRWKYKKSENYK